MARIAGIDLPREKRIEIGLTYIYGIGRTSANKILAQAGINPDTRVKDLTEEDEAKLREIIGHEYVVEGDLRRNVAMDIKRHPQGSQAYRRQQEEVRRDNTWLRIPRVRKWCVSAASVRT